MRTRLLETLRRIWNFLTVIPGWPDAGRVARTFYVLPLAVPFLVLLLLWGWVEALRLPEMRAVRAATQEAVSLEAEVGQLRDSWPESAVGESAAATACAIAQALRGPEDLETQLAAMRAGAAAHGWTATFFPGEPELRTTAGGLPTAFQPVRGRLAPVAGNENGFASLLTLLDGLIPAGKSGALTRLAVRVDDQGRLAAELGVRFAALPHDEKTP